MTQLLTRCLKKDYLDRIKHVILLISRSKVEDLEKSPNLNTIKVIVKFFKIAFREE
jgi:hypothetical protein